MEYDRNREEADRLEKEGGVDSMDRESGSDAGCAGPDEVSEAEETCEGGAGSCCHQKGTPRDEEKLKKLQNRLNRMIGQLNGIKKMLDDNRYCGDILIQVSAVESALQNLGYEVYQDHMETCVVEEIKKGNLDVVEEAVELMKRLK